MSEQTSIPVDLPALPKGGGAIQSIGNGLGPIGSSGAASCEIPLPVSPGRGYAPALALSYSSAQGNGIFGLGWKLSLPTVTRHTRLGVPAYTHDDLFVGPGGEVWMPERDRTTGAIKSSHKMCSDGKQLVQHAVVRYRPRIEAAFDLIEHWSSATNKPGFWLIHSADGSQHLYGKTSSAHRADPDASVRVGEWLLEESMNAHGEHILYEYTADEVATQGSADYRAQRYLSRVRYGNFHGDSQLYLCKVDGLNDKKWHFELCFDYGERSVSLEDTPGYEGTLPCSVRSDPFSEFAYGFELGTQRLCQQVLMFHYFPDETSMGREPILVHRLLLQYQTGALSYNCLSAALNQAFGDNTNEYQPPLEFTYTGFTLKPEARHFKPFEALARLNHQEQFQFVDLLGEGLPGILHRTDKSWRYSQPLRDDNAEDHVMYAPWRELPRIPLADSRKSPRQFLGDLSGDGRPDWIVAHPEFSGFFTLSPDGDWSNFTSFTAVPTEFFHPQGQLASLMGTGRSDLIMIGPRSVRLYANQNKIGFAPATEVSRHTDEDDLPQPGNSSCELVAFSDLLGSGQQHLIRIRHNEVKCWPNLGQGRFGKGRVIATLDFSYEQFDASRVLLADLDGSGAADLVYLQPDCARIFMNHGGNTLGPAVDLPWPEGLRHDRLCKVSAADLQGVGCSSLVFSVPGEESRHWRYDFIDTKPYLLKSTNNNMGASGSVSYRSSAQEWLDEKKQLLKNNKPAISRLPFPLFLVKQQTQYDEITGNRLTQRFKYRRGFYDSTEREFRGFGLLQQTDSPTSRGSTENSPHTSATLTKTWFHTGEEVDPSNLGYNRSDATAAALKATVLEMGESWGPAEHTPAVDAISHMLARRREFARALSGHTLRVETYGQDQSPKAKHPYSVQQHRYLIREFRGLGKHSPYSIVHPAVVESINYQYERIPDDPRCTHTINLEWDSYGHLTHSLEISYARRKTATDSPPFTDTWQNKWWGDAHDEDQQYYYLNETKAQFINVNTQGRRLGLRYLQRTNALRLPKTPSAGGLTPNTINYENILELSNSATWETRRVMTDLSLQRYRKPDTSDTFADGQASVEALFDHLETAELNELALKAYDVLKLIPSNASFDMTKKLQGSGYKKMSIALAADKEWDKQGNLWSVRRGFTTYAKLDGFFRALTFKESQQHGSTAITYDAYYCLTTTVKLPDNCTTTASNIDYRILQPKQITDPNGNVQEALYDVAGQVQAISYHKSNSGEDIGFKPIATYTRHYDERPDIAIENPGRALQDVASAYFYSPLSWMGHIAATTTQEQDWRKQAVAQGDLLPSGHVRASARTRLADLSTKTPYEQKLQTLIESVAREPVHCATMQADRFHSDSERQTRIAVVCWDGFGRQLQSKQKVEPGMAWIVNEGGTLTRLNDKPQEREVNLRWRVSERIEYDNKGLVIRTYRPYFSDRHRYINDESLRQSGLCDQHFHDPLGRLTRVINANGDERRYTYHPWYSITEDENDTRPDTPSDDSTTHGGEV
ncbi:toxin [Pseudomonas mandelii PD30]|uniref:Toxin n=1 Tax=Pseudomonas mandelii PD30 TaxID=1419583 RepID=A0A059L161_9PSED|nr:SpvB/TcaC N-terminal domain-containing protein [Pseudomonas mandelii]KDD68058.1 toxin [Pseudomonas mandelii PD30]